MAAYAVLVRTQAMAEWVHVAAVLLIAALTVAGAALAQKKRLLAELRQLRPPRDAADA